jgi:hypothetical protein
MVPVIFDGLPVENIPDNANIIRVPQDTDLISADVTDVSLVRSVYIPNYAGKMQNTDVNLSGTATVFVMDNHKLSTRGHIVTVNLLSQMCDTSVEFWPLVATIVHALKISPTMIRYRTDVYGAGPSIARLSNNPNPMLNWFDCHGYRHVMSTAGKYGTFHVFSHVECKLDPTTGIPVSNNSDNVAIAIVYMSSDNKPRNLANHEEAITSRIHYQNLGHTGRIPIFLCLPAITEFDVEWEKAATFTDMYPCTREYFDMDHSENSKYPRFVPTKTRSYTIPSFHPGPAFYSRISAPLACTALMFLSKGPHSDYLCIRESHHRSPIMQHSSECFRVAQ